MSSNMPHAISPDATQDEQDDLLIQQALDPENPIDFSRELEPGEKAANAVDYEDLADDDLADDEDEDLSQLSAGKAASPGGGLGGLESFLDDEGVGDQLKNGETGGDDFDDLFGELPSSPVENRMETTDLNISVESRPLDRDLDFEEDNHSGETDGVLLGLSPQEALSTPEPASQAPFRPVNFAAKETPLSREQQLQQELFAMSRSGFGGLDFLPPPPENQEELLKSLWPKFERGTILKFMDLLTPKKARYIGKKPFGVPKPVQPTKINLELAQDQEKSFKLSTITNRRLHEDMDRVGLVRIAETTLVHKTSDENEDTDSDSEQDPIGGVSWQDLQISCEDWDTLSEAKSSTSELINDHGVSGRKDDYPEGENQDILHRSEGSSAKVLVSNNLVW